MQEKKVFFYLRLNLQNFLPECVVIDTAKFHDAGKAGTYCRRYKTAS